MKKQKRHNVYVIELGDQVLYIKKFLRENPNINRQLKCFYIGMTGLTPEQRFQKHKKGVKSNKYAREYGIKLRHDIFDDLNQITYDDAVDMEISLAKDLRDKGYRAWQK